MIMKAGPPTKKVGSALAALEGVASGNGDATAGQQDKPAGRQSSLATPRVPYRVLDEVTRKRRLKHELDQLERDNFHDDPHANLTLSKKVPKFDDGLKGGDKQSDRRRSNLRLKVLNFSQLIEEDSKKRPPNYSSAVAPEPAKYNLPRRHYCGVCGYNGKYTCVTCGSRFCSTNCQATHKETRCLKWTS